MAACSEVAGAPITVEDSRSPSGATGFISALDWRGLQDVVIRDVVCDRNYRQGIK